MNCRISLSCAMGLESVLKFELYDLGHKQLAIENGSISLDGTLNDVIQFNLWCRTAGRVFIELPTFRAHTFDELFDAVTAISWAEWLPKNAKCTIDSVSSKNSDLFSKSDIQSITKKAIITKLQKTHQTRTIIESGPHIPIRVSIQNNQVTLKLDTSGHGLNKRGYRTRFDAPLRETLAAAMIKLSRWDPENDALIDPCCGSGTILIEAGMIANNIAPGLNQTFCSEEWPVFKANEWQNAREEALSKRRRIPFRIYGSDVNPDILKTARYNIEKAGLSKIFVETKDVADLRSRFDKGKIICNPPYGIRLEDQGDTHKLYANMGRQFKQQFSDWHYYILSGDEDFEEYFNQKATKKRKLFNGKIRCDLYQYFN
ncbi:MAG: THUMP domain-containing class I SAM-dependent RNA methyltransferase [Candidatus Marinamargulisbacteria bacterium]